MAEHSSTDGASRGLRLERIAASPRWDGERFRNTHATPRGSEPMPSLKDFLCGGERRVPNSPLPSLNPLDPWMRSPQSGLRATWLGHSTVLLEIGGKRVLTDPVWGPRASPSRFIGPKRFQPVPVSMSELPPLDAVLVSHDHYDHLDFTTMRLLRRINVPTLLLSAESRPGYTQEYVREMEQLIPGSKLLVFSGTFGFVHHSEPEKCAEAVLAFLRGL